MRDDFEKELQDVLSGFKREPDAGAWKGISRRIQGRGFSFSNPQAFMWGMIVVLLGGFLWWQFRPDLKEARHLILESGSQDTLILKTEKHKGYGLFERSYIPLFPKEVAEDDKLRNVIPQGISNIQYAREFIDFKPWEYEFIKKNNPKYMDTFLEKFYPAKIDTANIPLEIDNSIKIIVGLKGRDSVYIVDQNNNNDFRDDSVRLLRKIVFGVPSQQPEPIKCHYRIYNGKEMAKDSSWVIIKLGRKNNPWISVAHHLKFKLSLDNQEYEMQAINDYYLRFCFDSPVIGITAQNGIKKDSLLISERIEFGEYLKLGESYYKFEDMTNDGSEITLIKEVDISDKVGTTVGFIAPHFEALTTSADSVSLTDYKGQYLLLVNLTACTSPKMSYEYYKELSNHYQSRLAIFGIDVSPLTLQTNIDELGLKGQFMIAKYNKSIKDNYREDHCSRVCFLIGPDGRIADKFEIKDWKESLGKYFH